MKCLNWYECRNQAKPGHSLCEKCIQAATKIDPDERITETLKQLEQKPRDWRDAWNVGWKR